MGEGGGAGPLPDLGGYRFTSKHAGEVKNHLLSGITFPTWAGVLWEHWDGVDLHWSWHRVVFLTCLSLFTSAVALLERLIYGRAVERQVLHPRPVFILGHPRTGTTHIHNMLSMDKRFAYVNTFQAGFPSTFLLLERFSWLLLPLIDKTRPMDNMPLHFDLPQEDEIATNVLSGGKSAYMPIVFMRQWRRFERYYTCDGPACSGGDRAAWKGAFTHLLKKVTLRAGNDRPLLIKSPVHTAKVPLLLEMFPEAAFICVHRNPYEVFQSAAHMADSYYWFCYLAQPRDEDVEDFILSQGELIHDRYIASRALLRPQHHVEVAFRELEGDALETVEGIYKKFGWGDFEVVRATYRAYCGGLRDFRKNNHRALEVEQARVVRRRWRRVFDDFGYDTDYSPYVAAGGHAIE